MNTETDIAARPRALKSILFGGLAVGVLDLIDAVTFFGLYYAAPPVRIFQSIAAGVYGRDAAREGGWSTAVQGILLHFRRGFPGRLIYHIGRNRAVCITINLTAVIRIPVCNKKIRL